ncbi:hypothetical protein PMAYCL1PPCAC_17270 [Pristionchus mayeri]|uniref:G protein-coupled receptor n=1 Tax=Pristionchus mayeri TaxID=1317129 RepID=A0AAN5CMB1_9BILA|nr:hypothetical protein PMAYCL1PPCAC_17270 [Pristionchus mayeri]
MQPIDAIGIILLGTSTWTILVYLLVIFSLFIERKHSKNAFYTIYMVGSVADILSLLNDFVVYCSLTGFLQLKIADYAWTVRISHMIIWGTRFSQLLTVILISANRLTAIYSLLRHALIWSKRMERICAFIQIFSIFAYGSLINYVLDPTWSKSDLGGAVMKVPKMN